MKTKALLFFVILLLAGPAGLRADSSGVKTISISAYDTMKYSVTSIQASPGQKLVVVLKNEGHLPKEAMGHNWILLKATADPNAYARLAMKAKAENYEPSALENAVLAKIPLLGPQETGKVAFTAPTAPGTYHYLCSFPAHCAAGMTGVLIVK